MADKIYGTGVTDTLNSREVNIFDFLTSAQKADVLARTATLDTSAAFLSAIQVLGSQGGGVLVLPAGKYLYQVARSIDYDAITIRGEGCSVGTGSARTGATVILLDACDFLKQNSGYRANLVLENLFVAGKSISTAGSLIDLTTPGASLSNFYMHRVYTREVKSALIVGNANEIVCAEISLCQFAYSREYNVSYLSGAVVGNIAYNNTRFEPAGVGYSLFNSADGITVGNHKFYNCVFESANAVYAVVLATNFQACIFIGCHFENNGGEISGVPTNNGADVKIGAGQSNVVFKSCNFAYCYSTATNFIAVRNLGGRVCFENNTIGGMGYPGYIGFLQDPKLFNSTFIGNKYIAGTPVIDYHQYATSPVRINDYQDMSHGKLSQNVVKSIQTTDATPTVIWGANYVIEFTQRAMYITGDVTGVNSDGSVYAAFTLRTLLTRDVSNVVTIRGAANETSIVSGAQAAAFNVLDSTYESVGVQLKVTGIAATTINWMANLTFNNIGN